ncbi:energy transducer TonB [Candidatus Neomarinimicrobiota bacterium]
MMRGKYPTRIREVFLGVILACGLVFYLFPRFNSERQPIERTEREPIVKAVDIPPIPIFKEPPPPARPSIPIKSDADDVPVDVTIPETTPGEYTNWIPPEEPEPDIPFVVYDEPPVPIGGYEAIARAVVYPDIAREAGIEGTVVLQIFVNERGFVDDVVVLKGVPMTGLDEAAVRGIKKVRFKPAKQRDRKIGVWVSVAVKFRLQQGAVVVG